MPPGDAGSDAAAAAAAEFGVDLSMAGLMRRNYASRIFLALFAALGPDRYVEVVTSFLESVALLAAFISAFVVGLDEDDYEAGTTAANWHLALSTMSQVVAIFTTMVAILVLVQLKFYTAEESVLFTSQFGLLITVPLVGLMLSLVSTAVSIVLRTYIVAGDPVVWKVCAAVLMVLVAAGAGTYAWMDTAMRKQRFEVIRRRSSSSSVNTPTGGGGGGRRPEYQAEYEDNCEDDTALLGIGAEEGR